MSKLLMMVLLLGMAIANPVIAQKPAARSFPAMPVVLTEVRKQELSDKTWYAGTIVSLRKTRITSEGKGRILSIVQVGDRVVKGQNIAVLDDTLLRKDLAIRKAEAKIHAADLRYLTAEVKRLAKLRAKNNIALSDFEKVQAQRDNAAAQYEASQAKIKQTEENLRRMKRVAPFSGVVSAQTANVGEWLDIGKEIVVLTDTENLEISVALPAEFLQRIKVGEGMDVRVNNLVHPAIVRTIVPVAQKGSQLYELRLSVDSNIGYVNQRAKVGIPLGQQRNSIVIPEDALIIRNTGASVMIMTAEKKAQNVPVQLGSSTADGLIEVRKSSLKVGDQIIIRGAERLRDGMEVRPVSPDN